MRLNSICVRSNEQRIPDAPADVSWELSVTRVPFSIMLAIKRYKQMLKRHTTTILKSPSSNYSLRLGYSRVTNLLCFLTKGRRYLVPWRISNGQLSRLIWNNKKVREMYLKKKLFFLLSFLFLSFSFPGNISTLWFLKHCPFCHCLITSFCPPSSLHWTCVQQKAKAYSEWPLRPTLSVSHSRKRTRSMIPALI